MYETCTSEPGRCRHRCGAGKGESTETLVSVNSLAREAAPCHPGQSMTAMAGIVMLSAFARGLPLHPSPAPEPFHATCREDKDCATHVHLFNHTMGSRSVKTEARCIQKRCQQALAKASLLTASVSPVTYKAAIAQTANFYVIDGQLGIEAWVKKAKHDGAEIIIFPENGALPSPFCSLPKLDGSGYEEECWQWPSALTEPMLCGDTTVPPDMARLGCIAKENHVRCMKLNLRSHGMSIYARLPTYARCSSPTALADVPGGQHW